MEVEGETVGAEEMEAEVGTEEGMEVGTVVEMEERTQVGRMAERTEERKSLAGKMVDENWAGKIAGEGVHLL